jgi:hypothetical protein
MGRQELQFYPLPTRIAMFPIIPPQVNGATFQDWFEMADFDYD